MFTVAVAAPYETHLHPVGCASEDLSSLEMTATIAGLMYPVAVIIPVAFCNLPIRDFLRFRTQAKQEAIAELR